MRLTMAPLSHLSRIPLHDAQVGAHGRGQIRLVHHQQVALRDAGASLPRHLVAAADVDDVDDEVGKLAAVVGRQVVAARFDEQQVRVELGVEILQGGEVGGDVLAHGGVRAASGFDGADALRGEGGVAGEKLGILSGEDVVCDGGERELVSEGEAERQHQGRLARTNGAIHATQTRGSALDDGHLPANVAAGAIEDFVRVAVLLSRGSAVGVGDDAVVGGGLVVVDGALVVAFSCGGTGAAADTWDTPAFSKAADFFLAMNSPILASISSESSGSRRSARASRCFSWNSSSGVCMASMASRRPFFKASSASFFSTYHASCLVLNLENLFLSSSTTCSGIGGDNSP
ncbi:hypothetical protein Trco_007378 [Trichoderma cornu-damae]|uniref:Uncharacterized protein n=1 Tax=Trichoderma cornu-damae TaxID=654480 RepID=A0A9P8QJY1_9HYPO|nr:hypothetical protein Trco_007378 [Trichoderma cornu-damae]